MDVYPIYIERFDLWSWTIKNCFTVFSNSTEYPSNIAYQLMDICPDAHKKLVVERVKNYPHVTDDMKNFVNHYHVWLDTPDLDPSLRQKEGKDIQMKITKTPNGYILSR